MIPKKANKLYISVAEELNLNESLIETFIDYYYKQVREHLTTLKYQRINITGLGHFVVKKGLVKIHIPRITKSLENHDTSTFGAFFNKKGMELKLEQLIQLEEQINNEANRKINFLKTKHEEYTKNNMGQ